MTRPSDTARSRAVIHEHDIRHTDRSRWWSSPISRSSSPVSLRCPGGGDGAASVTFTVADGEEVTLSPAVYGRPGPGFDASETQTLRDASTGTFGPGEYPITVSLPDGDGSDDPTAIGRIAVTSGR